MRFSKSGKASSAAIFVAALVMLGSSPATAATDPMDTETAEAFAYANETNIQDLTEQIPPQVPLTPTNGGRGTGFWITTSVWQVYPSGNPASRTITIWKTI